MAEISKDRCHRAKFYLCDMLLSQHCQATEAYFNHICAIGDSESLAAVFTSSVEYREDSV